MIDIIIPLYNCKRTLENTLISIVSQTIKEKLNIILIDDYSSDNYSELIIKFSNILNIKYFRHEENKGAGAARKTGIDCSNGEYIIFLDSDDIFYSCDSVELLYKKIRVGYDYVDSIVYDEFKNINYKSDGDLHGKIYKRKFIADNNINFCNARYHEDNSFNNIVLINNPIKSTVNCEIYIYCNNELSLTKLEPEKEWERIELYIENMRYVIDSTNNCSDILINKYLDNKYEYLKNKVRNLGDEKLIQLNQWLSKYGFKKIDF